MLVGVSGDELEDFYCISICLVVGCKNTITVFPAHHERQQRRMTQGVWEAPPLYSLLQIDTTQKGMGEYYQLLMRISTVFDSL